MKTLLLSLLLLLAQVTYTQPKTFETKQMSFFPSMYNKDFTEHVVEYSIVFSGERTIWLINRAASDTLEVTMTVPLPDRELPGGVLMKGCTGVFNKREPALIGMVFRDGRLVSLLLSDNTWLMIYHIYYRINTDI